MERPGPFRSYQVHGDQRWRGRSHISRVRGLLANPGNLASEWLRGRAARRSFMAGSALVAEAYRRRPTPGQPCPWRSRPIGGCFPWRPGRFVGCLHFHLRQEHQLHRAACSFSVHSGQVPSFRLCAARSLGCRSRPAARKAAATSATGGPPNHSATRSRRGVGVQADRPCAATGRPSQQPWPPQQPTQQLGLVGWIVAVATQVTVAFHAAGRPTMRVPPRRKFPIEVLHARLALRSRPRSRWQQVGAGSGSAGVGVVPGSGGSASAGRSMPRVQRDAPDARAHRNDAAVARTLRRGRR